MPKKLDRNLPFGDIIGHESGARYVQDEVLFDINGDEMVTEGAQPIPAAPRAARSSKSKSQTVTTSTEDQVTAQLADSTDVVQTEGAQAAGEEHFDA